MRYREIQTETAEAMLGLNSMVSLSNSTASAATLVRAAA
jgi:hypothetical protein